MIIHKNVISIVLAVVLITALMSTGRTQALGNGAGLQASTITQTSLTGVTGATDLATLNQNMQAFVAQYGLNFDTVCHNYQSTTCSSLTEGDLANAKLLSTDFIEEWSKYPTALISYTDLRTINFVKTYVVTFNNQPRAAAPDYADKIMLYDISYAGSEAYMREVIHHEFMHYIQTVYQGGTLSDTDPSYEALNPLGFVYGSGGASCYTGSCPTGEHAVVGFATGYATSALVEDQAELYAHLFWDEGYVNLMTWIQTDTYLAAKTTFLENRLKTIVPSMDQSYYNAIHDFGKNAATNSTQSTKTTTISDDQSSVSQNVSSGQILIVDGKVGDTTIESGGKLMGVGAIVGKLTIATGAILAPGHSPGCITSDGLDFAGQYQVDIGGTVACTGYDQMKVNGTVTLSGSLAISLYGGFVPKVGETYVIISNDASDAVNGTFQGIAEGGSYTNQGVTYSVTYNGGDGNDVVLTVTKVDGSLVPKAPDTGFALVAAHPLVSLLTSTFTALALVVMARRMKPAIKR